MTKFDQLKEDIVTGKLESAVANVRIALDEGLEPQEIINDYLIKGMEERPTV